MTDTITPKQKYKIENKEKIKQKSKEYYEKNKDAIKLKRIANKQNENGRSKNWRMRNPEKVQENNLKKFGISLEDYKQLCLKQNNKCAICKIDRSLLNRNLCVDHDHVTLKVRGLLCDTCNRSIGLLKDDVQVLKSAIKYLENNLAVEEICSTVLTTTKE